MFKATSKTEYALLAANSDGEPLLEDDSSPSQTFHKGTRHIDTVSGVPKQLIYASILILLLSVLNLVLFPFTLTKFKDMPLSKEDLDALPYPPKSLGLERAAKLLTSSPVWVRSWPTNIARLSQKLKNAVYGDGVQVFISVEDSTLFRFPIPSSTSGSRSCAISFTHLPEITGRFKDLHTKGDVSEIEVWSIVAPNALQSSSKSVSDIHFDTLSWNTRPVRGELLGTLSLNQKPNSTTVAFGCPESGDDLVVEMRCLRVACEVQFKQVHMVPRLGFELVRRG
ncbi:hypothetical protein BDQ17DRAFT_1425450 [Cyathus striatus]|nr:hypothetical protein BDQ17DRAFT_1425450 [Cyathus striatus]